MEEFDIDECFESVLTLEESFLQEGREEGFGHGQRAGFEDGKSLGLERGFEFGSELGAIYGSIMLWSNLLSHFPDRYSPRTQKVITKLSNIIQDFPSSPTDEKYDEKLELIRNTFKQANSLMKTNKTKQKSINEVLSF
mmetsp:Transcript_23136/g.35215  ORF Transcript_23136/g.35215 Transcript_23136/m.35215 type:complete len:138 (-) Transcript_23136:148-561(-)